ncbi:MAG: DUF11 domain-containing protein, partial [Acidimicrobiales bacterium]|nr:DUF11 domain-containing protein [Acidimicrobiales bacterium]
MVIAILAAAIGGIALAATVRDALAAEIPSAITSVSVREDSVGVWDAVTVDIEWSVPDSASSGDTFRFTLPDALDPSVSGFELRAPDGQVVANAAISGTSVTFTLTDYVDTYSSVSGTAFFQNSIDRSVVTDDGDVPVTFQVHGGVTFTDVVEVTGTGYQIDRTVARKYGYFVDGQDQGRTDPVEAIAWSVESAMGPAATVEITDAPGAGHEIACSTVDVQIADAFEANGDIAAQHAADPGAYTLTCTAGAIGLTYTGLGDGEVVRLRYRTTITDQSVGNYTNGATIVMDDESWSRASNARRSNAGGDGGGSLTPSIAIEKYGTDAGPVDGDADEAPGQSVDAPTEVTMTITNDGDEALVDVAVADATDAGPALGGLSCDFSALGGPATGTTWAGPLAPAASFSCTGTLPALTGGQAHADTATVTATGQTSTTPVSDDDPWHAANPEVFDLALRKVLADGQSPTVSPLDLVDFAIEVFNQGNVTATDIAVTDHLPPGTVLADDDWTDGGDGTATTVLAGPLAPDTSTTVDVTLR